MTRTEIIVPVGTTVSFSGPVEVEMVSAKDGSLMCVVEQREGTLFLTGTSLRTFLVTA